ncbi:hypothetical protein [Agrobacterium larrymoorei]|uniref:Uncharacterized protein n=1 Tax=Agrobacterium larrymoorei TaxID=160699 RepID=A0ABU0UF65_9HYPH|nr:hypothetical protein [Agrobacterium larrymoorei]MDQ1183583.1 hypothetical protein [Agrobacterium larrymoorei]
MGVTPKDVRSMMLWEFAACADGFAKANGAEEKVEAPSYEEHLAMLQKLTHRS